MIILEIMIVLVVLSLVGLLVRHQIIVQIKEYHFYKNNGWDFSVDSGIDDVKLDERIHTHSLGLNNWQRFYLFRPFYIFLLVAITCAMTFSKFW